MIKPVLQDKAFVADAFAAGDEPGAGFRLWWLGQSGFLVRFRGAHLLFDPYLSDSLTKKYAGTPKPHVRVSERVVAPEHLDFIDVVTSTHNHTDHLDPETLTLVLCYSGSTFVCPAANVRFASDRLQMDPSEAIGIDDGARTSVGPFELTGVPAAHPTLDRDVDGLCLYLGYIARFGQWSLYHAGDTVVYDGMADRLRREGPIDVAILPINGQIGNMGGRDAARLAKDIGARLVIPCHYDMFEFNTADPREEFIPECERIGQPYRVLRLGERFSSSELPARG